MPDIKLGTSTFNDINVLQMYDVNNKLVRFYYEGLITNQPKIGINVTKVNHISTLTIQPETQVNIKIEMEES